jgi:transcriptional regulator with XRE-family HTH domain
VPGDSSRKQSERNSWDIASGLIARDLPAYGMNGRALVAWNLRRIRVQRGLSQERLAHDAEVDRSYVGGLERQEENPTVDVLDRLAKTLEVPVSELFKLPQGRATTQTAAERQAVAPVTSRTPMNQSDPVACRGAEPACRGGSSWGDALVPITELIGGYFWDDPVRKREAGRTFGAIFFRTSSSDCRPRSAATLRPVGHFARR